MTEGYSKAHFDFETIPWLVSPHRLLNLQGVALGLLRFPPQAGYSFTHQHQQQEEVYIVIEGSGSILINGELIALERGDIVRVSPESKRALKANEEGMFIICAGAIAQGYPRDENARYLIDDGIPNYDDIPPWYQNNSEVFERNQVLKKRMEYSQAKPGQEDLKEEKPLP
ncbi:MAG: cupin domain-containing protein [Synechococcaceae cyanobacterium SM2_3_1]|nr:cupin domain-containing protein [Synechococcaceae cyanobacterium SM2_3_1]